MLQLLVVLLYSDRRAHVRDFFFLHRAFFQPLSQQSLSVPSSIGKGREGGHTHTITGSSHSHWGVHTPDSDATTTTTTTRRSSNSPDPTAGGNLFMSFIHRKPASVHSFLLETFGSDGFSDFENRETIFFLLHFFSRIVGRDINTTVMMYFL